jgi:hypothetical protein
LKAAWFKAALAWLRCRFKLLSPKTTVLSVVLLPLLPFAANGLDTELTFADFNNQGPFNNFSGDDGTFASEPAAVATAFDTQVFRGPGGAALRVDYSVSSGFCGLWHSLLGKASYPNCTLNFTNLYGSLSNSTGNPSRVEGVRVTKFSFWVRGDGEGDFEHTIKVEFKNAQGVIGSALFHVPNRTDWFRCDFPVSELGSNELSRVKEVVFVLEDWRNDNRSGRLYLDDLSFSTDETPYHPVTWDDDTLLDVVSQRAFSYFLMFVDDLGFALDRSTYSDVVSVGAIGFQLSAYCVGHRRGWADRAELEQRVVTILQNLKDIAMGPEAGTVRGGHRGFYYHFLTANTAMRKDEHVELSLYDTMLLMYGILTCKEYFTDNAQIQGLSQELFDRVEWDWFVDRSPGTNVNRFYLGWLPEPAPEGTWLKHVDGQTDEALMVDILALGSKTHPVTFDTYLARNRVCGQYPSGHPDRFMVSWRGSLFNYFFANCWLDFRTRGLDLHPDEPRDLWENNRRAILANRRFCVDHASPQPGGEDGHYSTYGENAWGLTACDNLVPPGVGSDSEYFGFGALPTEEDILFGTRAPHVGTLAVYGAASCISFVPEEALAALRHYLTIPGLWSPLFGFGDAFSLDPHYSTGPYDTNGNPAIHSADYLNGPWINPMVMGINAGPMLLAIENFRSGELWRLTGDNPEIKCGLDAIFGIGSPPAVMIVADQKSPLDNVYLCWDAVPGAVEYNVYTSADLTVWRLRQGGIRETFWADKAPGQGSRFYCVKAVGY